ncbi:hypothetical protein HYW60_02765 [Candidatus Kaiserbacteria bacterium]|nr:hypothetical protein [Candidatus Kaiserbacteria bacterium]
MSELIIVKLGGSVITAKKSGKPMLRTRLVTRLVEELSHWHASASTRKHARLILLHGAGSFGHPLAHRYRLWNSVLEPDILIGVGHAALSMRELGNRLSDILLTAGIPVVPLQTSSLVRQVKGKVVFGGHALVETILAHGGVPLLGGDVVLGGRRSAIASADALAAALAAHFRAKRILFATDVDGVYEHFPPRRGERPLPRIRRSALRGMTLRAASHTRDVTGAMRGKLRALLPLRGCEVVIFNAKKPGLLADALQGKSPGSTVVL